ncbi:MAG: helix-turn-helix transcriptional regulator [Firmicutes bacterium]|nr:helix-turn-helix transcriptional regulator [Bacillota bacterium]
MEFNSVSANLIRGKIEPIIMKCLHDQGELYSLEIRNIVQDASGGTYVLKAPTMYSALARLEKRGYIVGRDQMNDMSQRRRYFKLTELGKNYFMDQKGDWRYSKDVVDTILYDSIEKYRFKLQNPDFDLSSMPAVPIAMENGLNTNAAKVLDEFVQEKKEEPVAAVVNLEDHSSLKDERVAVEEEDVVNLAPGSGLVIEEELEPPVEVKVVEDVQEITEHVLGDTSVKDVEVQEVVKEVEQVIEEIQEDRAPIQTGDLNITSGKNVSKNVSYVTQYFIQGDYIVGGTHGGKGQGKEKDLSFELPLSHGEPVQQTVAPYVLGEAAKKDEIVKEDGQLSLFADEFVGAEPVPNTFDPTQTFNGFERYISPNEAAILNKTFAHAPAYVPIDIPDLYPPAPPPPKVEEDVVFLKPFVKHFSDEKSGIFVLYSRLRLVVAVLVGLTLTIGLIFAGLSLRNVYQRSEEIMFVIGYVFIAVYLLINLVLYFLYSSFRRLKGTYKRELTIRAMVTVFCLVFILGANIIAGLTGVNVSAYLVYFLVPAILSTWILLEGVFIYFLKRQNFFLV